MQSPFTTLRLPGPFARRRGRGFNPASLFANGEQGAFYDPSDLSTLFQDDAGTTPVTEPGQTVGLMLDKSGNGNHAKQSTAESRPVYQAGNGLHWLEFDGVDDELEGPRLNPFQNTDAELSAFCGYRHLSAQTGYLFGSDASSGLTRHPSSYLLRASAPPEWVLGGTLNPLGINQNTSDQVTFVSMERNGITEGEYGWASSMENASIGTATSDIIIFGSRRGSVHAHMRLYQFLLIDRRVTEQERVATRAFVASNSGVTL